MLQVRHTQTKTNNLSNINIISVMYIPRPTRGQYHHYIMYIIRPRRRDDISIMLMIYIHRWWDQQEGNINIMLMYILILIRAISVWSHVHLSRLISRQYQYYIMCIRNKLKQQYHIYVHSETIEWTILALSHVHSSQIRGPYLHDLMYIPRPTKE